MSKSKVNNLENTCIKEENKFELRLFKNLLCKYRNENTSISPKAIELALGLIIFGVREHVAQEIRGLLRIDANKDDYEIACSFQEFYNNCRISPLIRIVVNIFPNTQYTLRRQFDEIYNIAFGVQPEYIDFGDNVVAAKHINCWVKHKTKGRIRNIVMSTEFKKSTSLVLVSAAYLKASWRIPFDPVKTYDGRFQIFGNYTMPVHMMNVIEQFSTNELPELKASVIELPFDYSDISMIIFLPNSEEEFSEMNRLLARSNIFKITEELKLKLVDLSMPRFRVEFEVDLKTELAMIDFTKIFSPFADFNYLLKYPYHARVSNFLHKVLINVNECGSETGKPSTVKQCHMEASEDKNNFVKKIIINRPFTFVIKDDKQMYFMGYVIKPIKRWC